MSAEANRIILPGADGTFSEKRPDIFVKRVESRMREVRDTLKRKLGDLRYQAKIIPFKQIFRKQMKKDDTGAYETAQWFIEALKRKKKLNSVTHHVIIAAAYELLEEKA